MAPESERIAPHFSKQLTRQLLSIAIGLMCYASAAYAINGDLTSQSAAPSQPDVPLLMKAGNWRAAAKSIYEESAKIFRSSETPAEGLARLGYENEALDIISRDWPIALASAYLDLIRHDPQLTSKTKSIALSRAISANQNLKDPKDDSFLVDGLVDVALIEQHFGNDGLARQYFGDALSIVTKDLGTQSSPSYSRITRIMEKHPEDVQPWMISKLDPLIPGDPDRLQHGVALLHLANLSASRKDIAATRKYVAQIVSFTDSAAEDRFLLRSQAAACLLAIDDDPGTMIDAPDVLAVQAARNGNIERALAIIRSASGPGLYIDHRGAAYQLTLEDMLKRRDFTAAVELALNDDDGSPLQEANNWRRVGDAMAASGDSDGARKHYETALSALGRYTEKVSDSDVLSTVGLGLSMYQANMGNQGLALIEKAAELAKSNDIRMPDNRVTSYLAVADAFRSAGAYKQAMDTLLQTYDVVEKINNDVEKQWNLDKVGALAESFYWDQAKSSSDSGKMKRKPSRSVADHGSSNRQ